MNKFIGELLPALLKTLSDDSDDVVLMNLKVPSEAGLTCNESTESKVVRFVPRAGA
jgi:hypothetical protein